MNYKGKKIAVIGFGRSGKACAKALLQEGATVFVSELSKELEKEFKIFKAKYIKQFTSDINQMKAKPEIEGEFGINSDKILKQDKIIISPGVPSDLPILLQAKKSGIPVIGELEFAYQKLSCQDLSNYSGEFPSPIIIGVTGTNGKTTTVFLIHNILESAGINSVVCGNIGTPLTEIAIKTSTKDLGKTSPKRIPIVEISSFQLENIKTFRPKVGVLLNVTADHLNRYSSLEDYREAKLRLFMNQVPTDFAILNAEDPEMQGKVNSGFFKSQKLYFSTQQGKAIFPPNIWIEREEILYSNNSDAYLQAGSIDAGQGDHFEINPIEKFKIKDLKIKWKCLLEDYLASILVAKCLNRSGLVNISNKNIIQGLSNFKGVPHRMEDIGLVQDIRVINNSMCTNPDAFVKVITSLKSDNQRGGKGVVLIAGGKEKKFPISEMVQAINENVKYCVLIGESAERLAKGLDVAHNYAKNMKEAVGLAFNYAKKGDIIILSPGFASFDWYTDFSVRGEDFKREVLNCYPKSGR